MSFRTVAVIFVPAILWMLPTVSAQTVTTTTVTAVPNPALLGTSVTLTATVSASAATGNVTFYDGAMVIGTAAISRGAAQLSTVLLPTGAQQLRARYDGDSTYTASLSSAFAETMLAATSPSFAAPVGYATQTYPLYLAVGDLNNDGKADLVVINRFSDSVGVYLGNGDGTFQTPVNYGGLQNPLGLAIADFNGDGNADVAVTISSGVQIFLGDGAGALQTPGTTVSVAGAAASLAAADTNGDGIADLVVGTTSGIELLIGNGAGGFTLQQPFPPVESVENGPPIAADFRNIGRADLAVPFVGPYLEIYLNNGDGTFQPPQTLALEALGLAAGDLNGDGKLDLAAVDALYYPNCPGLGHVNILFGNGDGTFQPVDALDEPNSCGAGSVVIGDFNGDGTPDLAAADSDGHVFIYYGTGQGNFSVPTSIPIESATEMAAASFTQGGTLDLAVTNFFLDSFTVLVGAASPCAFTVTPSPLYVNSVGGPQTLTVTPTGTACTYPISTDQPGFVHLAESAGYGNGPITVTIDPNATGADRTANLFVGGTTVPITEYFTTQVFTDVPPGSFAFDEINLMEQYGVTTGCGGGDFCPTADVTRAQIAVFIVTGIYGGSNFPAPSQTPYFADVPQGSYAFDYIQKLYELGITNGCDTVPDYCPTEPVTRGEAAKLITLARYGATTPYTIPSTVYFPVDVPPGYEFYKEIERMAEDGITTGCATREYCPADDATREQVAVFVMRGEYNLSLPPAEPVITSISPSTLAVGTSGTFTITGLNTTFDSSTMIVPVGGVTASTIVVTSPTSMTATLTSAPGSAAKPVSIYVQSGPQEAVLPNGLMLTAQAPQ
jgi:hypothetical protein